MRLISSLVFVYLLLAFRAEGAMVRVISIEDGRTIIVDRSNGTRERIRLAGVEVTDDARARDLLRWTAGDWVMIEPADNGGFLVYRSPDALFLNRELVTRGYARATLHGIEPDLKPPSRYLGTFIPPVAPDKPQKVSAPTGRTRSDTSPRSKAQPSPRPAAPKPKSKK